MVEPYTKEDQLDRSPGGNRYCSITRELKRSCKCRSCMGSRNRRKGQVKQRQARKQLEKAFGKPAGPSVMATAHEEFWRLPVRPEIKAGPIGNPVATFYRNTKAQSDLQKAIGDSRPFVAVAMIDGSKDGLVVIKGSDLIQLFEEARR